MFQIDMQMLYLGIGLLGAIIINILLGSVSSILQRQFDKTKFINGIIKGAIVAICFIGVYFIGLLAPAIILININGQEVTILTAIQIILVTSFLYYIKEVIIKLAKFVNAKVQIGEQSQGVNAQANIIIRGNTAAQVAASVQSGDRSSGDDPPSTI